jgi:hypothetical protein
MPANLMKSSDIRVYRVPKLTNGEMKKVDACFAIHYFNTRTSFHRMKEEHLLKVFQICRNNIKLPNHKKLYNELCASCYQKVKKDIDAT